MNPATPPESRSSLSLLFSVIATLLVVFAGLSFLASAGMSSAFVGKVPQGADAMGLVVPIAVTILGALALSAAALIVTLQGRVRAGGWSPWAFNLLVLVSGAAAFGILIAWMERMGGWVGPVGWLFGILAPMACCVQVIRLAWARPPETARA